MPPDDHLIELGLSLQRTQRQLVVLRFQINHFRLIYPRGLGFGCILLLDEHSTVSLWHFQGFAMELAPAKV